MKKKKTKKKNTHTHTHTHTLTEQELVLADAEAIYAAGYNDGGLPKAEKLTELYRECILMSLCDVVVE